MAFRPVVKLGSEMSFLVQRFRNVDAHEDDDACSLCILQQCEMARSRRLHNMRTGGVVSRVW